MAGVKGRSGGWNRLSPEEHAVRGSFRRDRHGTAPLRHVPLATRRAWARLAMDLDTAGFKLALRAAKGKVDTRQLGAAIRLLGVGSTLWARIDRAGGLEGTAPAPSRDGLEAHLAARQAVKPRSLEEYRRGEPRREEDGGR
jgi:hypothetical protein